VIRQKTKKDFTEWVKIEDPRIKGVYKFPTPPDYKSWCPEFDWEMCSRITSFVDTQYISDITETKNRIVIKESSSNSITPDKVYLQTCLLPIKIVEEKSIWKREMLFECSLSSVHPLIFNAKMEKKKILFNHVNTLSSFIVHKILVRTSINVKKLSDNRFYHTHEYTSTLNILNETIPFNKEISTLISSSQNKYFTKRFEHLEAFPLFAETFEKKCVRKTLATLVVDLLSD
jgi:hypothetical protein